MSPLRGGDDAPRRSPALRRAVDAVAGLLVLVVLVAPSDPRHLAPAAFLRVPVEGVLGVALLLALPSRARRVVAAPAGAALGLVAVLKVLDLAFFTVLVRPFDPVLDWALADDALGFLTDSAGRAAAIGALVAAGVAALAVPAVTTLSVLRLSRLSGRHPAAATSAVGVLSVVWVTCAALGTQVAPGVPLAADGAVTVLHDRAVQVGAGLRDRRVFAEEAAVDAFRDTPGDALLTGLRGKDVVLAFVESYGRSAVEDPRIAPEVDAVLDAGTRRLAAAGFGARSGFLTSPTSGGGSWLAHSTLLSGLWVTNEQRYRTLVSSDRFSLTRAFGRADWRTVGVEPGTTFAWPEGAYYGYDRIYDAHDLGYTGPRFGWSTMPDQFTLEAFERAEHGTADRGPLMAEITLTSSHAPWAPLPRLVPWERLGSGAVFGPVAAQGQAPGAVWEDDARVRTEYGRSVGYSLTSLISWVERYGDDDLVLVFLGDHQPVPVVTGPDAGRDVPVTIVARDRSVLDRISGWGWEPGLNPGPGAPVWRMDAFRDRFLSAFGPSGQSAARGR